jgi:hypothetical protein
MVVVVVMLVIKNKGCLCLCVRVWLCGLSTKPTAATCRPGDIGNNPGNSISTVALLRREIITKLALHHSNNTVNATTTNNKKKKMSNLNAPPSPFVPFSPNPSIQSGVPTATPPLSASAKPAQLGSSNLRYASSRKSIYDRHLNRTQRSELSKASFAFLFGEMIQYAQKQVSGIQDLEKK